MTRLYKLSTSNTIGCIGCQPPKAATYAYHKQGAILSYYCDDCLPEELLITNIILFPKTYQRTAT